MPTPAYVTVPNPATGDVVAAAHIERHDSAAHARLLAHGQFVLRVRGQAGVIDVRHVGLLLQPLRQRQRSVALGAHANRQRFHTLGDDPRVERRQHHAGGAVDRPKDIIDILV